MFYTWKKIEDPSTGWLNQKTSGWTADSFSGGLEVTFSGEKGMKAVRVYGQCIHNTVAGAWYYRKSGDTNISNTPDASGEVSHALGASVGGGRSGGQYVIWLSTDYKAQFAVPHVDYDLYIAYPIEYLS